MADFLSDLWHWFIIIPTVIGIFALFPLIILNTGAKTPKPETMGHVWDEDLEEYNNPLPRWWLNMFYITLVFGIVYLMLYPGLGRFGGFLGWTSKSQYEQEIAAADKVYGPIFTRYAAEDIRQLAKDPEAMKTGERLFATYCSVCHGSDARGARGFPNLRDNDWLYGGAPEQIKASILNGRNGQMPAWKAVLGEDGVSNVAQYVLSLSGREHDAAAAALGKEKFDQLCVACHKADGTGNQSLGAPNLADRIWLYGGSPGVIAQSIAEGRQGRMPPHREFLGEDKVHLLAAYVYSLSAQFEYE